MPDTPIYRVGPQPEGPLYVPDLPNNREGPQVRGLLSACMGRAMEKDWPKGLLITSYKRLEKKTLIGP